MNNYSCIFCKNIILICKTNKIKISDIENKINRRLGYLSRKVKQNSNITLDEAIEISKILNIPIDKLINEDLTEKINKINSRIKELEIEIENLKKIDIFDEK